MTKQTPQGRLVPFARSAKEVRGLAAKQQESGHPLKALELLRLSLEKAPQDPETLLALGDTYATMSCWTLSNTAYFRLAQDAEYAADCFYGMGCNFYAMHAYTTAHDCFALALQKAPDADFVPDALDLLDAIEEAGVDLPDLAEATIQRRMVRVLDAMDKGNASLATRQIRRVLAVKKRGSGIRSLQAFALLAAGKPREALESARLSYRADRSDVRAICAMASALKACGSMEAARVYLRRAAERISLEDDSLLVCQTACEMGEHAFVVGLLEAMERREPYADETLHLMASALHNSGQPDEAIRRWKLLRRIDPMDSVAAYRLRLAEEKTLPEEIPYARQVPISEVLLRLDSLRQWVHEGNDALRERWRQEDALEGILRWGLFSGEAGIPQAMCGILSTLGDEKAQIILREVLCDLNASAAIKHSALAALHATGLAGPFYALMNDRLTLVHVSRDEETGSPKTQASHADDIVAVARKWLGLETPDALLTRLGESAASAKDTLSDALRARAVVLAYCARQGIPSPMSSTFSGRRKAQRLASRLLKEESHGLPEL